MSNATVSDYRQLQQRIGTSRVVIVTPRNYVTEHAAMLRRLPTTLVFDHLGRLTLPAGLEHPAYKVISDLVDAGRTWIKLSGPQLNTLIGPPTYADATAIAQAWVRYAPQRVVWGSDWPHPSESHKPDYSQLLDLLPEWAPLEATRHQILVTNPEYLYGF